MTKLADPTIWTTPSGMELELKWSVDETMATLYVHRPNTPKLHGRIESIRFTIQQLDELREFLSDNLK
jgi:hypothetical protein